VVDFIDVGIGANRFWVFNVADVAVHAGVILLLFLIGREPRGPATSPEKV
jgi:lipoprotein signal peptidase